MSASVAPEVLAKLAESGLTSEDALKLGIHLTPQKDIMIPYHSLKEVEGSKFYRIRLLEVETDGFTNLTSCRRRKYTQPTGMTPQFFLPRNLLTSWEEVAQSPGVTITFTEGEFKAACACKYGFTTIGLGGVWAWRSKKKGLPLIEDFNAFEWVGRPVNLVFDSDMHTNEKVMQALMALATELTKLGAVVSIAYLPDIAEVGKTGLDDFIVAKGVNAYAEVLRNAEEWEQSSALWSLNKEVAYVTDPGIMIKLSDGMLMNPSHFTSHAYSHLSYSAIDSRGSLKDKRTATEWLKWPHRLTVKKIVYEPQPVKGGRPKITESGCFNTWKGWGREPVEGCIKPWVKLLDTIFGDDVKSRKWFEQWCAYPIQNPGCKLSTAVLFWGVEEGTGKSLIGYTLGEIYGTNFEEIGNLDLHGQHGNWMAGKQLVLVDEVANTNTLARWADGELLKKLITQKKVWVDEKYEKKYTLVDTINYFMTSNNPDAVKMGDHDRRMFIMEVLIKLSDRFYARYDKWFKGQGTSHLLHYFLSLDTSGFNPQSKAPFSAAKKEMIIQGKSDLALWVYELREQPEVLLRVGGVRVEGDMFTISQLLNIYSASNPSSATAQRLGRELKKSGYQTCRVYTSWGRLRVYVLRNAEHWDSQTEYERGTHYEKFNAAG